MTVRLWRSWHSLNHIVAVDKVIDVDSPTDCVLVCYRTSSTKGARTNMTLAGNPFPTARRIVTTHDAKGRAIYEREDCPNYQSKGGDADFHFVWRTTSFPTDLSESPPEGKEGVHSPGGSLCRIVDIVSSCLLRNVLYLIIRQAPQSGSPMHRTISLDYGIMIAGSLDMILDDGTQVTLRPGDTVVQRGTIHSWQNNTDEWVRIAFVLIDAKAPVVDGRVMQDPGFQQ